MDLDWSHAKITFFFFSGAYAAPTDVRIKKVVDSNLYQATFTTYTPAMRESERKIYLNPQFVGNDKLVVLVVGTTLARFRSKEEMLQKIANSFEFPAASKALWWQQQQQQQHIVNDDG